MMETRIETITPEIAEKYLQSNKVNRPIRQNHVGDIARDIKAGKFNTTHQGIAFDEQGNLIDGQHRLLACVKAGVPIQIQVTRGEPASNMANIDNGAKRNFRDFTELWQLQTEHPAFRNAKTIGTIRSIVRHGYNAGISLTNNEIAYILDKLQQYIVPLYKSAITRGKSVDSAICAALLAAMMDGENENDIFNFVTVYLYGETKGCDEYNVTAALGFAKNVWEAKARQTPMTREKMYMSAQNAIWLFIHGENTKFVRAPKQCRYPVVAQFKAILE